MKSIHIRLSTSVYLLSVLALARSEEKAVYYNSTKDAQARFSEHINILKDILPQLSQPHEPQQMEMRKLVDVSRKGVPINFQGGGNHIQEQEISAKTLLEGIIGEKENNATFHKAALIDAVPIEVSPTTIIDSLIPIVQSSSTPAESVETSPLDKKEKQIHATKSMFLHPSAAIWLEEERYSGEHIPLMPYAIQTQTIETSKAFEKIEKLESQLIDLREKMAHQQGIFQKQIKALRKKHTQTVALTRITPTISLTLETSFSTEDYDIDEPSQNEAPPQYEAPSEKGMGKNILNQKNPPNSVFISPQFQDHPRTRVNTDVHYSKPKIAWNDILPSSKLVDCDETDAEITGIYEMTDQEEEEDYSNGAILSHVNKSDMPLETGEADWFDSEWDASFEEEEEEDSFDKKQEDQYEDIESDDVSLIENEADTEMDTDEIKKKKLRLESMNPQDKIKHVPKNSPGSLRFSEPAHSPENYFQNLNVPNRPDDEDYYYYYYHHQPKQQQQQQQKQPQKSEYEYLDGQNAQNSPNFLQDGSDQATYNMKATPTWEHDYSFEAPAQNDKFGEQIEAKYARRKKAMQGGGGSGGSGVGENSHPEINFDVFDIESEFFQNSGRRLKSDFRSVIWIYIGILSAIDYL